MGSPSRIAAALLFAAALCRAGDPAVVSGPLVSTDRWPRTTGVATWTRDVMRIEGLENATETAQGKAFHEWVRLFCRMAVGGMIQAFEGERGAERSVMDAHKSMFVYGWGFCDTCSRAADAAWKEYKGDPKAAERVIVQNTDGGYHTMYRLRMDGKYGAFDPRYGYYLVERDAPDARILDWGEIGHDENFLKNRGFRHRSRPFFEIEGREWQRALSYQPGWFDSEPLWRKAGSPKLIVFGNSHYRMGTRFHDMDFRLPKGTVIERFWDNTARKFYVPAGQHTKREMPFLPSGRFYRVTDASHSGTFAKHDPNYKQALPYLATVPRGEGYPEDLEGGRTIGQAWGAIRYEADLKDPAVRAALASPAGLDFYSPYVLVDGSVAFSGPKLEIRTLRAKPLGPDQPDAWSEWQPLAAGKLDSLVHGIYRFQLRGEGIASLRVNLSFENGIMSIPQIFAGSNTVRFNVRDASLLRGPVKVTYKYRTAGGPKEHTKVLQPADFRNNEAVYTLEAPGLERCDSLAIAY